MTWIVLLIGIALALFLVEFIVPGGILAIVGFLAICVAAVIAFNLHGAAAGLGVFVGGGLLAVMVMLLELKFLSSSRISKRWFQHKDVSQDPLGFENVADLVGKTGEALTPMTPTGKVMIEQTIYPAASLDGFLPKGSLVVVKKADRALIRVSSQ